MGDYSITLKFDDQWIGELYQRRQNICFAIGVGSDPTYNVIAWTGSAAPTVNIQWQARYQVAATTDRFMEGARFSVRTRQADINLKQVYTLREDWKEEIRDNQSLEPGTFQFINATRDSVSAVIYQRVNGQSVPIYISRNSFGPQTIETLSPKLKVAVWLQGDAMAQTMVSKDGRDIAQFDMSNRTSVVANWNGQRFV